MSGARAADDPGVYRIVPLAELDAPEAVKQQLRAQIARARSGVIAVPNGSIPTDAELVASLPTARRSRAELVGRLPNPPTNVDATMLGAAELLGMEPSGALNGLKSSGLTRFFRLPKVGVVEFNEDNFRAPGVRIEAIAEAQNSTVNGMPAQLEQSQDASGRSRVLLMWAGAEKVYTLIAIGDGDVQFKARALSDIAAAVKD